VATEKVKASLARKTFILMRAQRLRYLLEKRGIDRKTIVSYGQSLGTAVATNLAAETNVGGVVLEAPFPSIAAMAQRAYWFLRA